VTAISERALRSPAQRYRHALWLLASRDLRKRYSTSALGYIWSILDPLLMSGIYWFVFTVIFDRGVNGDQPYIIFLLTGLLPWTWFNGCVSDATRVFEFESKLIKSTKLPRTIWISSLVLSKGVEFLASIPVLVIFSLFAHPSVHWQIIYWVPAIALQAVLCFGIGLIVAPLVVFLRDLHRAIKLILRVLFYASPIVYGASELPGAFHFISAFNPLTGIFSLFRSGFFPDQFDGFAIEMSVVVTAVIVVIGFTVFRRTESAVLKEL
jgi:ABC-2 type transport system permease protein